MSKTLTPYLPLGKDPDISQGQCNGFNKHQHEMRRKSGNDLAVYDIALISPSLQFNDNRILSYVLVLGRSMKSWFSGNPRALRMQWDIKWFQGRDGHELWPRIIIFQARWKINGRWCVKRPSSQSGYFYKQSGYFYRSVSATEQDNDDPTNLALHLDQQLRNPIARVYGVIFGWIFGWCEMYLPPTVDGSPSSIVPGTPLGGIAPRNARELLRQCSVFWITKMWMTT